MCFIGLMIFPVSGLMFFHFHLVAKANTTNEQVQISLSFCLFVSRYGHLLLQVTSKFKNSVNPYDQGCLTNCGTTFCGPLYGKYVEWWKVGRSRILPSMRHQFPYVSRVRRVFSSISFRHLLVRDQQYTSVQKTDEHVPFSPSASPTQIRLDMTDFSSNTAPMDNNKQVRQSQKMFWHMSASTRTQDRKLHERNIPVCYQTSHTFLALVKTSTNSSTINCVIL